MQEPTIYRAPVVSVDSADGPGEDGVGISTIQSMTVVDPAVDKTSDEFRDFIIPEDRKLGVFSTTILIINRVVGTGLYSTPSAIIARTESVGATLLFWVLGGLMTFAGLFVYLEYGTALPRSGGEKVYLERVYQRPRYLATCIFAVQFVLFAVSTGNTISFANYVMRAAAYDFPAHSSNSTIPANMTQRANAPSFPRPASSDTDWPTRGVALVGITLVCLIHAFAPKMGIWLSNILGCLKLIILMLVVCTGFAVLSGKSASPLPRNFSSFHGPGGVTSHNDMEIAGGYALALLQVLYSYSGWENANYVLTEVRDAPKTLKIAAPLAVSIVTVFYVLANIAFFAAMSKQEIADSKVTVAASFFQAAWGDSVFVTRVVPFFIALSALGNIFAQSFAMPRVKQELAKEGILPFSKFFASDWPFNAPSGAIFLHWLFTVVLIMGLNIQETYTFLTNIFIYTGNWIKLLLGVGLVYLRYKPNSGWDEQRTTFTSYTPMTVFWIISLLYSLAAPFTPNDLLGKTIPFWVMPTLGTSMLAIGVGYWLVWANLLPMFGYQIQHEVVQLPDGSERVKYVHVPSKRPRRSVHDT